MTHNIGTLIATERERWLNLHFEGRLSIKELSLRSGFSRDTLHRWKKVYLKEGLVGLKEKSRAHHFHPNTIKQEVVLRIRAIREETRFCAAKIRFRLLKEGISLSTRGIHKVLKGEDMVKTKRRFPRQDTLKPKATVPGEMVEIDIAEIDMAYMRKYKGKWLYQFTAIDSYTRWRFLKIYKEQHIQNALAFVVSLIKEAPFKIQAIKTDNGFIFTNRYNGYYKSTRASSHMHAFTRECKKHGIAHYLIAPGNPAQNGKVERSHRTDRAEFWNRVSFSSFNELQRKQSTYMDWYNQKREHLGIGGKTPMEFLKSVRDDVA